MYLNSLLEGKKILIMGIANKWSIAWGIAQSCLNSGADLILTYQGDRTEKGVRKLIKDYPNVHLYPCDVTSDEDIVSLFQSIKNDVGTIHGVVHSIAFARKEDLEGAYCDTSRDGYLLAQNISAYSLVAVCRNAKSIMTEGGSIVTMTYLGGERVVPNYNVMGVAKAALESSVKYLAVDLGSDNIRVNAISAGPVKTVAAQGIKGFGQIVKYYEQKAPLKKAVDPSEIGDTGLFLLSNLSRGITGETIHVDGGYHVMGLV